MRAARHLKYTWKSWRRRSQHLVPSLDMPPWQACSWVVWSKWAWWTRSIIICGSGGSCWRQNATRNTTVVCGFHLFYVHVGQARLSVSVRRALSALRREMHHTSERWFR
ncbi:unnamed protein product, partial [Ectocarpus sp. 13 AM-2016]